MHDPHADTALLSERQEFGDTFFAAPQSPLAATFGGASHVGRVRKQNEDHFAVIRRRRCIELLQASLAAEQLAVPDECAYAMVVADGMGGMKSGELASRMALQTMLELAGQATSWVMKLTDPAAQQIEQRVNAYVERVHATLREHGESDPSKADMGTTWTSAHLLGRDAVIVHLGDSRAYLFRDGRLRQITRDQTMAQALVDGGLSEKSVSKFRHIVLNSFGGGIEKAEATIHHLQLQPDDRLLLCTDGLPDMVHDDDIAAELNTHADPQSACDALIEQALTNGGKDNVTVVVASLKAGE